MEWIKCKDKFPDFDTPILLFDQDEGITVGYYWSLGGFHLSVTGDFATGGQLFNVTHWMPLPDAPKDKE